MNILTRAAVLSAAVFSLCATSGSLYAQRAIGGRALLIDDNAGNVATITVPALAGGISLSLPTTSGTLLSSGNGVQLSPSSAQNGFIQVTGSISSTESYILAGTPNAVTNARLSIGDGHLQVQQTGATSGSTVATGVGTEGIGGTAATFVLSNATDIAGRATITTTDGTAFGGTAPAAGDIATVTFNQLYMTAPIVVITPTNALTAQSGLYLSSVTTSGFTVALSNTPTDGVVQSYGFTYHVIETQ